MKVYRNQMFIAYNQNYMVLFYKGLNYENSVDITKRFESSGHNIGDYILYRDELGKSMHPISRDDYMQIFTALFNGELDERT